MKNTIKLFLALSVMLSFSACSSKTYEGKYDLSNETNQASIEEQNQATDLSEENYSLDDSSIVDAADSQVIAQNDFNTYSNNELGLSFNYPKTWPEPTLIKNVGTGGAILDVASQWEIGLSDLHKNSYEGADKYFASIRGFYTQSKSDILKRIKSEEEQGMARIVKETGSYIVYNEVGMYENKNIMVFGDNKSVKIKSIDNTLDSDIDSIAESLILN